MQPFGCLSSVVVFARRGSRRAPGRWRGLCISGIIRPAVRFPRLCRFAAPPVPEPRESQPMLLKLTFVSLAVAAGVAVAFQGATNQGLLKSAGIGPALVVNTVVVLLGTLGLWAATGARPTFFPAGT